MIKHKQQICLSGESGFTIIESLVALLVVAILLTAIAPVIVLATATRIQSRRVELATQAVKTYIDGVRTGAITALDSITPALTAPTDAAPRRISTVSAVGTTPAATGSPGDYLIDTLTKMPVPTASTGLYCFNKNGLLNPPNCTSDLFYIQAARINVTTTETDPKKLVEAGYRLGIRVYRADADFSNLTASTDSTTKKTQLTFTGGAGSRQAPLIEMTTDIASSTTSFHALCQRLGVATNKSCQ